MLKKFRKHGQDNNTDDGFFRPVMKCDGEKSKRWTTIHELLDTSVRWFLTNI
ncbi:hypothetical protein YC2023_020082 [Brassica napus]